MVARTRDALQAAADAVAGQHRVRTLAIAANVASGDDCRRAVEETASAFGRLDVLVTNTGGPRAGAFDALDDDAFAAAFESTLMNVVRLVRAAVPHMKARQWGRVINITSISARQPIDGLLLSNTIRPAVVGLAKSLSFELAPQGILVNNVCPGICRTDRMEELVAARSRMTGRTPEQVLTDMTASIPLQRMGEPAELAALVAFLASEAASFITGTTIACDGGASRGLL